MSELQRRQSNRDEIEQPESRARVLVVLMASVGVPVPSTELCRLANTNAAVRRVWELGNFYGYRIIGEKEARNCWTWTLVKAEAWARDPSVSVPLARAAEKARLEALDAETRPSQPISQPSLFDGVGA